MILKTAHGAVELLSKKLNSLGVKAYQQIGPKSCGYIELTDSLQQPPSQLNIVTDQFSHGGFIEIRFSKFDSREKIEEILRESFQNIDYSFLERTDSFRVSCDRHSDILDLKSQDIERNIGAIINQRSNASVKLKGFSHELYIEILPEGAFYGWRLNRVPLDRWFERIYSPGGALQNHIANLMIDIADLDGHETVLDAFSGSGTIGINLLRRYPKLDVTINDISEKMLKMSKGNFESAGIMFPNHSNQNVTSLDIGRSVDLIVGNTPFGHKISTGQKSFQSFFQQMLQRFNQHLKPSGKIVLIIFRIRSFENQMKKQSSLKLNRTWKVFMGGLSVHIVELTKETHPLPQGHQ